MWLRGFSQEAVAFYNFEDYSYRDYVNDKAVYTKAIKINAGYNELMNNKLLFNEFIGQYAKVPRIFGSIKAGKYISLGQERDIQGIIEDIPLILKRISGGGGYGIYKVLSKAGKLFINNQEADRHALADLIKRLDGYLVCECIDQAEFLKQIFSGSINSLKVLTMIDPDTDRAFIAGAFFRIGTKKSAPVDNLGPGGVLPGVDIDSGEISVTKVIVDGKVKEIDRHPDTGALIKGVKIPDWEKIKEQIIELAERVKYIRYIAWDLALQEDGFIVIEGNANSELHGFQMHKPLLLDERVRKFYQYYGVVK